MCFATGWFYVLVFGLSLLMNGLDMVACTLDWLYG